MGICIITVGVILLLIPLHSSLALAGFIIIGLGCAPIYPCIIHMTPSIFGADKSQAMIGVQMAFAYTGFLIMPSLFGVIAENISISLLPVYQLVLLGVMAIMHERVLRKNREN
jgi:fucose permease